MIKSFTLQIILAIGNIIFLLTVLQSCNKSENKQIIVTENVRDNQLDNRMVSEENRGITQVHQEWIKIEK